MRIRYKIINYSFLVQVVTFDDKVFYQFTIKTNKHHGFERLIRRMKRRFPGDYYTSLGKSI